MTEQVQVAQTSANVIVAAAQTYLTANVGHYQALCNLALATALLQCERNAASQPELSASTAAERATASFEEALLKSGTMKAKTVDNVSRTMRKACAFAIKRMQAEKTLYTLELSAELFAAEFETLEGFAPNLRDIDAAVSANNGTARAKKPKADKAEGSNTEAAQEAVTVKADAAAAEKLAGAVKIIAALLGDVENHALFQSQEVGDMAALIIKVRREASQSEEQEQAQAA